MKRRTFAYWRAAPDMQCPLVVNEGEPSECRLVARGRFVHIYHYSKDFCPLTASRRRTASGKQPNPIPTMKTPMKAAATKGAMKGAAKGAMKGAAKAAKPIAASKGYAKK